ncbi:SAV_2336 N-terminal domain-related protein [Streptomyces vietnamensis]|uniref:SAV_2336 N-terminal domain-related protein n=1 Tax=Streptomyces vietnamensis TaxID=362257 RepID=UPI00069608F5|nr:SAV_2336 N-terminal domain-related protein [Streptomyces vietnamensis]
MSEALDRLLQAWANVPLPSGAEATVLADALWLAASGTPAEGAPKVHDGLSDETTADPEPGEAPPVGGGAPPDGEAPVHRTESRELSVRGAGADTTVRGVPMSLGRADPLPDALAVGRAIQPFRRPWPRGGRDRLDVEATVEHYARGGPLVPLFHPAPEPWFEVVLLVDSSLSMSVWEETTRALTRLLTALGGFRTVHTWHLAWEQGAPVVRDHHGHEVPGGRVPHHGGGTRGRRMVLMVSDCAARGWHTPAPWLLLREWGERVPVALLDPLPPRLWRRSALNLPAVRVTAGRAGARNGALRYTLPPRLRPPANGANPAGPWTALPVVSCTPRSLGAWASTLMRADPRGCDAVLIPATGRPSTARDGAPPPRRPDPARLAEAFTRTAPTPAVRLAVLCAGLPELPLPLLHVLRDQAVPEARYADLAELLTSGLFAVRRDPGGDPVLALRAEAREHLGTHLTTHDMWLTKAALSHHAAAHPYAPQGITAVLHDALADTEIPAEPRAFAEKNVLVRQAGTATREARDDDARGMPPEAHRPGTTPREDTPADVTEDRAEDPTDAYAVLRQLRRFLEHSSWDRGTQHAELLLWRLTSYLISRLPAPWGGWPGQDTCFDDLRATKGSLTGADVLDDLVNRFSPEDVTFEKPVQGARDTGHDLVWKTPGGILSVDLKTQADFSWAQVTDAVRSGTIPPSASGPPVEFLLVLDESDKPEGLHDPASCVRLIRRGTSGQEAVVVLRLQTRYGRTPQDSRATLTDHLVLLHQLAGFQAFEELAREAAEASPPIPLDPGTLSDWFLGHAVPADERAFDWLTRLLVRRAGLTDDAEWSPYRLAALRHHALGEERRAKGRRSESLGRPITEFTGSTPEPHIRRPPDLQLRAAVEGFATGTGGLVLLIGAPGSGRTDASLEALRLLPDGYRVWEPPSPAALAAELDGPSSIGPHTVVRLEDAARHLLDESDGGLGERISAALRARLRRTDRDPVLVLGLLTPEVWNLLMTPPPAGAPDPHAQARALCREALSIQTPRTPGEDRISRYLSEPAPSRALLDAAIDARRCGHGPRLPLTLLRAAAPHYLPAPEQHSSDIWLASALDSLCADVPTGAALLSPVRPPAHETETWGEHWLPEHYLLSDELERYGSWVRDGIEPPEGLWDALAAHASRHDLEAVARAARERGDTARAERFHTLSQPTPRPEETLTPHDIAAPALRKLLRSTDLSDAQAGATVDRALEWLRVDPLAEEAQFVLNGLLSRTGLSRQVKSEAVRYALDWLDAHGAARAAEFVLGPLLAVTGLPGEQAGPTVHHALDWLGIHGQGDSAQFVLRPLLLRGDLPEEQARAAEGHALGWLEGRETDIQSQFALSAVLRKTDLDRTARNAFLRIGFDWLRAVDGHTAAKFVLRPLLQRSDLAPEEVRTGTAFALAWLREHGAARDAQFVLSALLHRGDLTPAEADAAVGYALAWLRPRTTDRAARFVLSPLLARTDLSHEAKAEAVALGTAWSLGRVGRGESDHGVKALVDRVTHQKDTPGRLILIMEIVGYAGRTTREQEHAQRALHDLASRVLPYEDAALRESWSTGDGMVVLFPVRMQRGYLVPRLLMRLESALNEHDNFGSLRLRIALHHGTVERKGAGWFGPGLVTAARLVESAPLRATLKAGSRAPVAVAISDALFSRAFATDANPASTFRVVFVGTKEGAEKAWISVAGYPEPPGIDAWTRPPGRRQ